jgi:CheY-like chemotaxis protein
MAEPDQGVIHFTVWDTGIGITAADLTQLFKPFVQLDSSLSRQYEGTGLGLVLVSRLAELHQGSVSVESDGRPGRGSRFTVSLPGQSREKGSKAPEPMEAGPDPIPPSIAAKSGARHLPRMEPALILLAEDNEANIRFMTECLTDEGYRIVVARNGLEAIERVREEQPALVLMDIQMPGLDGLEVTRRIRAEAQLANLPIIALTALAMPGDQERCLAAGANDYVSKPFRMNQLVNLIETYLTRPGDKEKG